MTRGIIPPMVPIGVIKDALELASAAAEVSKKLFDFGRNIQDRAAKEQVEGIKR